ncbi:hypothetical protein NIES23_01030 [Trichormus variabilis NIES-23]|uniref:Uncharacterized protein n=1 Tax=Trichormus variabilis NIES-23 TaxID=1973479 RepID=A0A1Z4KEB4_ANAVA|nr:hypothetical protein NIES23_01030 [Trichormus variabilis NIES-23]
MSRVGNVHPTDTLFFNTFHNFRIVKNTFQFYLLKFPINIFTITSKVIIEIEYVK